MIDNQDLALEKQEFTFKTLNLQVGIRLQLMTHRHVKPATHFSTLIGYVKDEYLIVRIPSENGNPISLREGERITVRMFSGVDICSFVCSVERTFVQVPSYVHLSFPTAIEGSHLRAAIRVKTELQARITRSVNADAPPANCTITDISITGARLALPFPLVPGEELLGLQFAFEIPGSNEKSEVDTLVRICNARVDKPAPGQPQVYSYGVQFLGLDPMHYTLLENLVYKALLVERMLIV